jgi:hypothetical protein
MKTKENKNAVLSQLIVLSFVLKKVAASDATGEKVSHF